MSKKSNYLIGRAELLAYDIAHTPKRNDKKEPYTFQESITRLTPQIEAAITSINALEDDATPNGDAVCRVTMHPEFYAKSYFPKHFLREFDFEFIGDKPNQILPDKWTKKSAPKASPTTDIFVAGHKQLIEQIPSMISNIAEDSGLAQDFRHIWKFSHFDAKDKIKRGDFDLDEDTYEVGLQLPYHSNENILNMFLIYAEKHSITVHENLFFRVKNLTFLPVTGSYNSIQKLAEFSYIRLIRKITNLRNILPPVRSSGIETNCALPNVPPLSTDPKVAILDGGLPDNHPITNWLTSYKKMDTTASDVHDYNEHGLAVTSAFLFGPIDPQKTLPQPYAYVDHLRILDSDTSQEDPLELFRTLGFIEETLLSGQYDFINLSLGPDLPIEDDDLHVWTSVIDDLLQDGNTLLTVAIGNNGQRDNLSRLNRIQVPSDCVNALSVGACHSTSENWNKAPYSAVGPGRSPGVVKPDLLAFGGSPSEYFHVLSNNQTAVPTQGTSFAAPYTLRNAVGIRSTLGRDISLLTIKALLIHSAIPHDSSSKEETGWGKLPESISDIIATEPGEARIVYQGELKPGKLLRAPIPIPDYEIKGMVTITATFCYATVTEPQSTSSYTQSGLEITFRPDLKRFTPDKKTGNIPKNPDTDSFFKQQKFATEAELRHDAGQGSGKMYYTNQKVNEEAA